MKENMTEEELATAAAKIDNAAQTENTGGIVDEAIGNTTASHEPVAGEPAPAAPAGKRSYTKKKSHKKGGGKTTRKPKKTDRQSTANSGATAGAREEPAGEQAPDAGPSIDETFLRNALASAVNSGVQLAKRSGWTSPGTQMVSEQDWVSAVAHCVDALRIKYLGDSIEEFQEEAALLLLVAPWAISNVLRILDERRRARTASERESDNATRFNGQRQKPYDGSADSQHEPGNSGRPDEGRSQLPQLGNRNLDGSGSAGTDARPSI